MLDIWNEEDRQDEWWDFIVATWQDRLEVIETRMNIEEMNIGEMI